MKRQGEELEERKERGGLGLFEISKTGNFFLTTVDKNNFNNFYKKMELILGIS